MIKDDFIPYRVWSKVEIEDGRLRSFMVRNRHRMLALLQAVHEVIPSKESSNLLAEWNREKI